MITDPICTSASPGAAVMSAAPIEAPTVTESATTAMDLPWNVVVWDDPVNLMSYVTYVFRSYFGFSQTKAQTLMLEVHHNGRSVVASGTLEEAEKHVSALHAYGLWATYEQAGEN